MTPEPLPEVEPWTPATCFHLLLSILGWQVLVGLGLLISGLALRTVIDEALITLWGGRVVFVALELVWLYVLRQYRRRGGVKPLWQEEELSDGRFWLLLVGAVALCMGANLIRDWLAAGGLRLNLAGLAAGAGPVQWGPSLVEIGAAAGLAPIAEEWFFRGIVQGALTRRWGPWLAVPATALGFGVLHGRPDMWVVTVYGLVFGLLAHRRPSLTLPILVHVAVNLVALGVPIALQLAGLS